MEAKREKDGSLKVHCCPDWKVTLALSDGSRGDISMDTEGRKEYCLHLSDLPVDRNGRINFEGAADSAYVCPSVIRAVEIQRVMDGYLSAGKMTPVQRSFFLSMAFSDLNGYKRAMDAMPLQVDFTTRGIGDAGDVSDRSEVRRIEVYLDSKAKEVMRRDDRMDYSTALKIACSESPSMAERRDSLKRTEKG